MMFLKFIIKIHVNYYLQFAGRTKAAVGAEDAKASCHSDYVEDADAARELQEEQLGS